MLFNFIKKNILRGHSDQQIIIKNSFWLFLGEVINRGIVFILFTLIARQIGVSSFGQLSSALAFVTIFSILTDFGTSTLFIKDVSRNNNLKDSYFYHIVIIKIILSFLFLIPLFVLVKYLNEGPVFSSLVYLSYVYVVLSSFVTFLRTLFKAHEKMKYDAYSYILNGLVLLILVGILIYFALPIYVLLWGYIVSTLIAIFITLIFLKRIYSFKKIPIKKETFVDILRSSTPFLLSAVCVYVYYYIDQVLLFNIQGPKEAGIYASAYRILALLIAPIGLFLTAFLPTLSKNFNGRSLSSDVRTLILNNIKVIFFSSFVVFLTLFVFSKEIITIIYGNDYIEAILILRVLLISWLILINYSVLVICLQAFNQQKTYFYITFWGALFNIILNVVLIIKYSTLGAAVATVLTELFVGITVSIYFFKNIWYKLK